MNEAEKKIYQKVNKESRPYYDRELRKMYNSEEKNSARYCRKPGDVARIKTGWLKRVNMVLVDMLVYPIDICPFCNSEETFHRRHHESRIAGTCWNSRIIWDERGIKTLLKIDYCLRCQREFLIESYTWKKPGAVPHLISKFERVSK